MIKFDDTATLMNNLLTAGGFLSSGDKIMTISWGMVGVIWRKKIFLAVVRKSRYTHSVIEQNKTFTVSVPYGGEMKGALGICGSVSARDGSDKWAKAGLEKQKAKSVDGYVVKGCKGYLECRVVTRLDMGACDLKEIGSFYADGDMHDFYFAEIMDEYYG